MQDDLENPFDDVLDFQLRRAALMTFAPYIDGLAELGLKPTEAAIVELVHANPGCTQSAIGRALGVKKTNISPAVARLEKEGWLSREAAGTRRRGLSLTESGRALRSRIVAHERQHDERCYGFIPAGGRKALLKWCKRIQAGVAS